MSVNVYVLLFYNYIDNIYHMIVRFLINKYDDFIYYSINSAVLLSILRSFDSSVCFVFFTLT